ncbi:MAG: type II secretion system F family protein, partial [Rhodococcus sp. (in: high G+C Gram-positive bacteria)]
MIVGALLLAGAVLVLPARDARARLGIRRPRRWSGGPVSARLWIPLASASVFPMLGAAVGCACAIVLATLALRHSRTSRRLGARNEAASLVSAIETVVAELRVGAHPAAACRVAAQDHSGSVGTVFASVAASAELGGSMCDAVDAGGQGAEWSRVAAVWRVAEVHGLRLASLLDAVRNDMRARARSARRLDASMAGPRATATVLASL